MYSANGVFKLNHFASNPLSTLKTVPVINGTSGSDELVKQKIASHSVHYQAFMYACLCMESLRYAILHNEPISLKQTFDNLKNMVAVFGVV